MTQATKHARLPTFFLSHGGGPWPYVDGAFRAHFTQLEAALKAIPGVLKAKPRAVLMISGHWEALAFTVTGAAKPPMVFDYSGFQDHPYQISYPEPVIRCWQRACAT